VDSGVPHRDSGADQDRAQGRPQGSHAITPEDIGARARKPRRVGICPAVGLGRSHGQSIELARLGQIGRVNRHGRGHWSRARSQFRAWPLRSSHARPSNPRVYPSQNIFQSFQAGALAWKRNLFHHILPDELRDGVNFPKVDAFFNEAVDHSTVGVGWHGSPSRADSRNCIAWSCWDWCARGK